MNYLDLRNKEDCISKALEVSSDLSSTSLPELSEEGHDKSLLIVINDNDTDLPIIVLQINCSNNRLTITVPWHVDFPVKFKDYVLKIVMEEHDLVSLTINEKTWKSLLDLEKTQSLINILKSKHAMINGDGVWLIRHFDEIIILLKQRWSALTA
jgi:hypothetical protein